MPVPESATFWAVLGQVMRYAVDVEQRYSVEVDGAEYGVITPKLFLDRLYVSWDEGTYEKRLVHHLRTAKSLVVVAGGRGAGKTSSLYSAASKLENEDAEATVLNFNIRRLYDRFNLRSRTPENAYAELRSKMELEVRQQLFADLSGARKLASWLLAGSPDPDQHFDNSLRSDLHDVSVRIGAEVKLGNLSRDEKVEALEDWFARHGREFASLHAELTPLYRVRHSLLAYTQLHGLRKIVLIYDNADKLPAEHQTAFVEFANDTQISTGALATTCVAIRTEHLRGAWEGQERGGTLIHLVLPNERQYPGVLLPRLEQQHIKTLLENRHRLAQDFYSERHDLSSVPPPVNIFQRVILTQFRQSSVERLTNENLRAVAALYVGFMQYMYSLSEKVDAAPTRAIGRDEKHAHTLFFLWLRSHGPLANIHLYDVLSVVDTGQRETSFSRAVSIHHFLLTAIANLTDRIRETAGPHEYPEFREIHLVMSELGFQLSKIRDAIRVMVGNEEEEGTLEFVNAEPRLADLNADSKVGLRLTNLGEVLVTEVFSKVGYVWSLAYSHRQKKVPQQPDLAYLTMNVSDRIRILFEYIADLATAHLRALELLRPEWYKDFGEDWLDRYRSRFGIRNRVQVERILEEAAKFFRRDGKKNIFDTAQEIYTTQVENLRRGKSAAHQFASECRKLKGED